MYLCEREHADRGSADLRDLNLGLAWSFAWGPYGRVVVKGLTLTAPRPYGRYIKSEYLKL